jgi:hypothetical protein
MLDGGLITVFEELYHFNVQPDVADAPVRETKLPVTVVP